MKTKGDSKGSIKNRFLFSNFFANLYYFFVMHIYVVLTIIGSCVSIAILLFLAELTMPDYVHFFNYSLTNTTFNQLVKSHRYHSAIAFLEYKDDVVMDGNEFFRFRQELADCYVHTGDYPKALEQYRLLRQQIKDKADVIDDDDLPEDLIDMILSVVDAALAKEEFRIYLKMGDKANILKQHNIIKDKYSTVNWTKIHKKLSEKSEKFEAYFADFDLKDGFKLELLQGEYILNPDATIPKMERYAKDVVNSTKYNPGFKLKVLSEFVRMLIEQGRTIAARHYLEIALSIVDDLQYDLIIYPNLGDISEYCYRLNDIANGRRLLKKYLFYIDDTYDESDIDYAVAHALEFKYLQADGDWDKLTKRLADTSRTLRRQIARNFTGMTSAQREYFIAQFRPILTYANDLMPLHPSNDLANVCFENNMFLRGLLLRSETALANSIAAMGNEELTVKFRKFVDLSQELVARQYVSGPGNYFRKSQIEREIASIESELAAVSRDFRRDNDKTEFGIEKLRQTLSNKDVAVQIVESANKYYALLLSHKGKIKYIPIGEVTFSPAALYVDVENSASWLGRLLPHLEGRNVYYVSDGIFNKISLSSLPIESTGKTIGDVAQINLMGSLADIPEIKDMETALALNDKSIILWGGVDYGTANDSVQPSTSKSTPILRGEELRYLPGSKVEVNDIAYMLKQAGNKPMVYTGRAATEKSFTSRSHKKDYILHISTHGFFHDSGAFMNPMQNAGLLFANSQEYWMNNSLTSNINETDGILRADEIAKLDLTGCRLVVLSACQTGVGNANSEGVYGLQRAFKLAGVKSVLMSLWNVDDEATCKLMTYFYAELLSDKSLAMALTNAQNSMRREGYSSDKWAAFVLLN